MIGAVGTLLFFAITPVFAQRAARELGPLAANVGRLMVALWLLGGWAHAFGLGVGGGAFGWFFLGGVVGFGIGGVAMFQSLPRIGAMLSTLIVQCLSVIVAGMAEWWWLGTRLAWLDLGCIAVTLGGIVVGLLPRSLPCASRAERGAGIAWAILSAAGQGVGAVISRKAFAVAASSHVWIDPGTAAYQRVLGGLAFGAIVLVVARGGRGTMPQTSSRAWPWVVGNALTGPVLGVTCFQWALRTTPAAIVQPIVAAAPLLTIPLAVAIGGAPRPRARYYAGCLLAIAGVVGLLLQR